MWPPPEPGDIVWCRFSQRPRDQPGPKPRPALIVATIEYDDGVVVKVAYGTSQKLDTMLAGEFANRKAENSAAYVLAGLSYDTKFDLNNMLHLPWNGFFFWSSSACTTWRKPKTGNTSHLNDEKAQKRRAHRQAAVKDVEGSACSADERGISSAQTEHVKEAI